MTNYEKGRRGEYQIIKLLKSAGYDANRTAGSHGMYDVIAVNKTSVRLIQAKINEPITPADRETFQDFLVPKNVSKEIWFRKDRQREWQIEIL
jgi:hypothetical protein